MGIEMGVFTQESKTNLFKLEQLPNMSYEKDDDAWISISIERNLDKKEYSRTIYTGFDFLSDIGGLVDFLFILTGIFVNAWNFNSYENALASKIYNMKPERSRDGT